MHYHAERGNEKKQLANRVRRGAFSAVFLVQIFMALGVGEIKIERLIV